MRTLLQRRAKCITLLSLVFLAAAAACSRPAKLAPLASDAVVLAFGDSLTCGTGAAEAESYPAQLERLGNAQAAQNVRAMVQLARSRGVAVLLVDTPEPEVLKDASLKSDPIHPNARGYRVIAERIAARLRKSGAL